LAYITDYNVNWGDFLNREKIIFDYISIAFGSFCLALSVSVFFVPYKITSGGISTVGTVVFYVLGIPLSITNLILNAVLFVFGYKTLDRQNIYKTISGILFLTLFLELCSKFPPYTDDMLIATLAGGIIMGLGIGVVVRFGGSTGGTDFLGLIIHKRISHLSIANIILYIDCVIIAIAGLIFRSITVTLYSAIALFISARVCDAVISFGNTAKAVSIISLKHSDIANAIISKNKRGVTGIYCRGMYSGEGGLMLYCIVSPRELPGIIDTVRTIDSNAFIVISDAREVFGNGFKLKS